VGAFQTLLRLFDIIVGPYSEGMMKRSVLRSRRGQARSSLPDNVEMLDGECVFNSNRVNFSYSSFSFNKLVETARKDRREDGKLNIFEVEDFCPLKEEENEILGLKDYKKEEEEAKEEKGKERSTKEVTKKKRKGTEGDDDDSDDDTLKGQENDIQSFNDLDSESELDDLVDFDAQKNVNLENEKLASKISLKKSSSTPSNVSSPLSETNDQQASVRLSRNKVCLSPHPLNERLTLHHLLLAPSFEDFYPLFYYIQYHYSGKLKESSFSSDDSGVSHSGDETADEGSISCVLLFMWSEWLRVIGLHIDDSDINIDFFQSAPPSANPPSLQAPPAKGPSFRSVSSSSSFLCFRYSYILFALIFKGLVTEIDDLKSKMELKETIHKENLEKDRNVKDTGGASKKVHAQYASFLSHLIQFFSVLEKFTKSATQIIVSILQRDDWKISRLGVVSNLL
jgi:hypothetical protein